MKNSLVTHLLPIYRLELFKLKIISLNICDENHKQICEKIRILSPLVETSYCKKKWEKNIFQAKKSHTSLAQA